MSAHQVVIAAVATRVTQDEADRIDALPFGTRADNLRVLIRFALAYGCEVQDWFDEINGKPIGDSTP